MKTQENRLLSSEKLCKRKKDKISSSVSFHQYFQVLYMNFKICFRYLVLFEMISFENISKTVALTFSI